MLWYLGRRVPFISFFGLLHMLLLMGFQKFPVSLCLLYIFFLSSLFLLKFFESFFSPIFPSIFFVIIYSFLEYIIAGRTILLYNRNFIPLEINLSLNNSLSDATVLLFFVDRFWTSNLSFTCSFTCYCHDEVFEIIYFPKL